MVRASVRAIIFRYRCTNHTLNIACSMVSNFPLIFAEV